MPDRDKCKQGKWATPPGKLRPEPGAYPIPTSLVVIIVHQPYLADLLGPNNINTLNLESDTLLARLVFADAP